MAVLAFSLSSVSNAANACHHVPHMTAQQQKSPEMAAAQSLHLN